MLHSGFRNADALDVDKFDKILTNLVSNALKYSPEESSIKIDMAFVDKNLC